MTSNISVINTRENFKVRLSIPRLKELFVECFNGNVEDDDFSVVEDGFGDFIISFLGWGEISGEKVNNNIIIKHLNDLNGDFSGLFWDEIFLPIFEEVKLNAEIFVIWEQGEEIILYKFKDGIVEDVKIDLFEYCK